ncbi:MAG: FadR/GntR family transcriptional regulator [Rhodoglobus sp.]
MFDLVLHDVGGAIVRGDLAAGAIYTVEGLEARTGASRSIVREATRVLANLGMLQAGRRVGLRILPRQLWDALDPLVIRWRLDSLGRVEQLEELRGLRQAVEPEAAAAAARRVAAGVIPGDDLVPLLAAAAAMAAASGDYDPEVFLTADRDFHFLALDLSGNAMFRRLQSVVDESLRYRALTERVDLSPDTHDVDLHIEAAQAIASGDSVAAAAKMREIVDRTS